MKGRQQKKGKVNGEKKRHKRTLSLHIPTQGQKESETQKKGKVTEEKTLGGKTQSSEDLSTRAKTAKHYITET